MLALRPLFFLTALAVLAAAVAGSGDAAPVKHATAAKKAPPTIVVKSFRFVGFDKDVVGRFRSTKPDGEKDGHFRVVLVRPPGAPGGNALMILRCASKPASTAPSVGPLPPACEGVRPLASMVPAPSKALLKPAVLAVFRDGKKLSGFGLKLPLSSKPVTLDLYVTGGADCPLETGHAGAPDCRAAFAPGQRYVLMVMQSPQPSWSAWVSRPGDKVPQVTSPQAELRNMRFVGLDKDVVGRGGDDPPDGKLDAHWTVKVATPAGPRMVMNVTLERARADTDRPDQPICWGAAGCLNAPQGNPGPLFAPLYVSLNGERVLLVPPGRATVELSYTTTGVRLDLYATDVVPSVFTAGQRFRVTARISPEALGGAAVEALPKFNVSTPWLTLP